MTLLGSLDAASEALAAWRADVDLAAAHALLASPTQVVVAGRIASGSSSLLVALGADPPPAVGLGGCTEAAASWTLDGWVWTDTPGVDTVVEGLDQLGPRVAEADLVVWVADGLQPITRTALVLLRALLEPPRPLRVVVARADLIPTEERAAVVERVAARTAPWLDGEVHLADLRQPLPAEVRHALFAPLPPGPHRRAGVRRIVSELIARFEAEPPPPDPRAEPQRLHEAWRGTAKAVLATAAEHPDALWRATRTAQTMREAFETDLSASPLYRLLGPPGPMPRLDAVEIRPDAPRAAATAFRRAVGHWLLDGELVLDTWWGGGTALPDDGPWRRREAALDALRKTAALSRETGPRQ